MNDDTRPLCDFVQPSLSQLSTGIRAPAIAESFEIKPGQLSMFSAEAFRGLPDEDPYAHLANFNSLCETFKINSLPNDAIKLRCFMFSLKDRAKEWERSMPQNQMDTWEKVVANFLARFYPPARTTRMKNEINSFRQVEGEGIYEAWERFKDKIRKCPHHGMPKESLVQIFYDGLYGNTKTLVDAAAGGSFMQKTRDEAYSLLEQLAKNNFNWATERSILKRPAQVNQVDSYATLSSALERISKQQEELMARLGEQKQQEDEFQSMEELNFIANQGRDNYNRYPYNTYNPGWRNPNLSWRQNQGLQPPITDQKKESFEERIERSMRTITEQMNEHAKTMEALKNQVKGVEVHLGQVAERIQNRDRGRFPSTTETAKACNSIEELEVDALEKGEPIWKKKVDQTQNQIRMTKSKEKKFEDPKEEGSSGPARKPEEDVEEADAKQDEEDEELFQNISKLKSEIVIKACLDMHEKLASFVSSTDMRANIREIMKFIKDVCEKTRSMEELDGANSLDELLKILKRKLPKKTDDPGSISIPIIINNSTYLEAYCDQGSAVNVMSKTLYEKLKLNKVLQPFSASLVFADNSKKQPRGIIEDVLVKVHNFHYLVDFVILDMKNDRRTSLLLGRPFLATANASLNIGEREIRIKDGSKEATLSIDVINEFFVVKQGAHKIATISIPRRTPGGRKNGENRDMHGHEPP